ncbi:hypothetical protein DEO72_LG5g1880 [Vigna unguiculata]|uniref:Uncharacterized protein n=1 Tax=Vigna unguiculata TaxID=3917 RepID=A0A4D6M165_VIGUN|nr:hypothetical protein DEO72_LG5g1880 [Vigna unguiculata]
MDLAGSLHIHSPPAPATRRPLSSSITTSSFNTPSTCKCHEPEHVADNHCVPPLRLMLTLLSRTR